MEQVYHATLYFDYSYGITFIYGKDAPDMTSLFNTHIEPLYVEYRSLLIAVAYRITGMRTEAEDIVQDLFIHLSTTQWNQDQVHNVRAYLIQSTVNRSLNVLESARIKRVDYPGVWLPEPQVTENYSSSTSKHTALLTESADTSIVLNDDINYAVMVMLDQLTPIERAIFVLRESFDFPYRDIALWLDRSEAACRKILSRALPKVQEARHSQSVSFEQKSAFTQAFLQAAQTGNFSPLLELLQQDMRLYTDGGGKVKSALRPIFDRRRVISFFNGIAAKGSLTGEWSMISINGDIGLQLQREGITVAIYSFRYDPYGQVDQIFMISNPDKIR